MDDGPVTIQYPKESIGVPQVGRYKLHNEIDDCIDCVAGKYVDVAGSDAAADCIDCVPGKYVETPGRDDASRLCLCLCRLRLLL